MHFYLAELFGIPDNYLILLVGGAALIYSIRRWRSNVVRRNRAAEQESSSQFETSAPANNALNVREVAAEIAALLADLEETARRVAAQIENRKIALDHLLKEADEKIRRLEALNKISSSDPRPTAASLSTDPAS